MEKTMIVTIALMVMAAMFPSCTKVTPYEDEAQFVVQPITGGTARIVEYSFETRKSTINIPPRIQKMQITEIGPGTFADWSFAKAIIPDSVVSIMDFSFSGNHIREVRFSKRLTEIGVGAFMSNRLESIVIPGSVKKIAYRAFCDNPLTEISIGGNVEFEEISGYDTGKQKEWKYTAFEGTGFDEIYAGNDRKAGTYRQENGVWHYVSHLPGKK